MRLGSDNDFPCCSSLPLRPLLLFFLLLHSSASVSPMGFLLVLIWLKPDGIHLSPPALLLLFGPRHKTAKSKSCSQKSKGLYPPGQDAIAAHIRAVCWIDEGPRTLNTSFLSVTGLLSLHCCRKIYLFAHCLCNDMFSYSCSIPFLLLIKYRWLPLPCSPIVKPIKCLVT